MMVFFLLLFFFFFNDTSTTEIYTLSLHDALPISIDEQAQIWPVVIEYLDPVDHNRSRLERSEEHTSELQSRQYLVCRLLLEKKKQLTLSNVFPGRLLFTLQLIYYILVRHFYRYCI